MYYSHTLEKGLSHSKIKPYFGVKVVEKLLSLIPYYGRRVSTNDYYYNLGHSVLNQYYITNKKFKDNPLSNDLEVFIMENPLINNDINGGAKLKKTLHIGNDSINNYYNYRFSTRNWSKNLKIDDNSIKRAISNSLNTPSSCNTQPWRLLLVKDENKMAEILKIQNGLRSFGGGISHILIVYSDISAVFSSYSRNQPIIDASLFSMSLLINLNREGISTVTLNANFSYYKEKRISKILKISMRYKLIMFIACGYSSNKDSQRVPLAKKFNLEDILI